MGAEQLEESEFEPMYQDLRGSLSGKHVGLFGSYGWGGQSIGLVEEELKAAGCDIVLDKQRLLNTPDENTLEALREAVHTII